MASAECEPIMGSGESIASYSRIVEVYKIDKLMTLLGRVSAVCDQGGAQGQGRGQRSRDTGTFVISQKQTKSLLLRGKWLDRKETPLLTFLSFSPFPFFRIPIPKWL